MTIQAVFAPTTSRQRPPKPETVERTAKALLHHLKHDQPMEASCGISLSGFHFVRLSGVSNGVSWQVDIYRCRLFIVSASTRKGVKLNALMSVIPFLQAATV